MPKYHSTHVAGRRQLCNADRVSCLSLVHSKVAGLGASGKFPVPVSHLAVGVSGYTWVLILARRTLY